MKKLLSILLVLMLAVLPAMAEQTGIQLERQVITLEFTSPLLEGVTFKVEEDVQYGEYYHELINVCLNDVELVNEGVMLDQAAKQLFISYPAAFENVLVFDEEDLNKVVNAVSSALVEVLDELKNDPEFINTMAELMEALAKAVEEAIVEAEADAAARAAIEELLATLNYENLAKEMESIFTPAQKVYTADDGSTVTEYSFTLDQGIALRFVSAVAGFFADNAEALGGIAPDAETMAQFNAIIEDLLGGVSITGSVGMNDKNAPVYANLDIKTESDGESVSIGLTAADVKEEDKESVLLAFDVTLNGENAGIRILIEDYEDHGVIRLVAAAGEEVVELGRIEVKAVGENDVVIRVVLGTEEEEMELARITAHVEFPEPIIAFVEGGETVAPLKMSEDELGQFLQNAMTRMEAYGAEMGAKIEEIMAPIMEMLMPEVPAEVYVEELPAA